jgi:hypothetical protein
MCEAKEPHGWLGAGWLSVPRRLGHQESQAEYGCLRVTPIGIQLDLGRGRERAAFDCGPIRCGLSQVIPDSVSMARTRIARHCAYSARQFCSRACEEKLPHIVLTMRDVGRPDIAHPSLESIFSNNHHARRRLLPSTASNSPQPVVTVWPSDRGVAPPAASTDVTKAKLLVNLIC